MRESQWFPLAKLGMSLRICCDTWSSVIGRTPCWVSFWQQLIAKLEKDRSWMGNVKPKAWRFGQTTSVKRRNIVGMVMCWKSRLLDAWSVLANAEGMEPTENIREPMPVRVTSDVGVNEKVKLEGKKWKNKLTGVRDPSNSPQIPPNPALFQVDWA